MNDKYHIVDEGWKVLNYRICYGVGVHHLMS